MNVDDTTIEIQLTDDEELLTPRVDAAVKAMKRPKAAEASEFTLPQTQTVIAQILANHGIAPKVIPELSVLGFQLLNGVPTWYEEGGRMRLFYTQPSAS